MSYKDTAQDYQIKYSETYLGYAPKGSKEIYPFYVEQFQDKDNGLVRFKGNILKDGVWNPLSVHNTDPSISFNFPRIGAINFNSGFVLYLSRKLNKQYRKTFNPKIIHWFDPFETERNILGFAQVEHLNNKYILQTVFNNVLYTPEEALTLVESSERVAAAFSDSYYIGIKNKCNAICLFKRQLIVGHIINGDVHLKDGAHQLSQEISDYGFNVILEK